MTQKRKSRTSNSIGKTILNLIVLIPTFYSLVGKVFSLMGYEARLAGKSILKLILLAIATAIILASTWLCLLAMAGVYLVSVGFSYLLTLTVLILLNILVLAILIMITQKSEKNLLFQATRQQIRHAFKKVAEE